MTVWVALLRGINVGGHRRVLMADLRAVLERAGHAAVTTYLQSGNVVLTTGETEEQRLQAVLEDAIEAHFGFAVRVLVRSGAEIEQIADASPFGRDADPRRVGVVFLSAAPARGSALDPAQAPDQFVVEGREIHIHCPDGFGRTPLTNASFERALGLDATTRNLKTVRALADRVRSA